MSATVAGVPTASGRMPVVGHIPRLVRRPLPYLQALRREGDIVMLYLGRRPVCLINAPELIHQFMVEQVDSFEKGRLFDKARAFVGNGITVSSGEFHRRQRRILQPAFNHDSVRRYTDLMSELAIAKSSSWHPGQALRLDDELHELALAIAARTLVSSDLEASTSPVMREAVPVIMGVLPLRTVMPGNLGAWIPTRHNRHFTTSVTRLRRIITQTIHAYQTDVANQVDHGDLLSSVVQARYPDTGEPMSVEQICDEVMAVLIGGYGAVKSVLTWLFIELSAHPDIEQRLHQEIDGVVGLNRIGYDDIPKLSYTRQVINETLRLHHVALMLNRRATQTVTLGSTELPAGTELMFSQAALHRDPLLYPDPMRFDPQRWQIGWKDKLPQGAFIPFSIGPHQCIGSAFAMAEMHVIIAAIAARWSLRLKPGTTVREVTSAILAPNQAPMTVARRQ